jgi:branched-chain amino acid transport system substrate-binding protein
VADELYLLDEKDFKTELSKIKSANPDLIYVIGTATSYVTIFNQAKEIGLDKPYLSVSSTEDPVFIAKQYCFCKHHLYLLQLRL